MAKRKKKGPGWVKTNYPRVHAVVSPILNWIGDQLKTIPWIIIIFVVGILIIQFVLYLRGNGIPFYRSWTFWIVILVLTALLTAKSARRGASDVTRSSGAGRGTSGIESEDSFSLSESFTDIKWRMRGFSQYARMAWVWVLIGMIALNVAIVIYFPSFWWKVNLEGGFWFLQAAIVATFVVNDIFKRHKGVVILFRAIALLAIAGTVVMVSKKFRGPKTGVAGVTYVKAAPERPSCGNYLVVTATRAGSVETVMPPGCYYTSEPIEPRDAVYEVITPIDSFTSRPDGPFRQMKWVPKVRYRATSDSVVKIAISLTSQ